MKFNVRSDLACKLGNAYILDNQCIRASLDNLRKRACSFCKLMVKDNSIKSYISSNTPLVQRSHDLWQFG